jgi:hypothetical protein
MAAAPGQVLVKLSLPYYFHRLMSRLKYSWMPVIRRPAKLHFSKNFSAILDKQI